MVTLFFIFLLVSVVSAAPGPDPHISFDTRGFLTAKADSSILHGAEYLPNHGALYGELHPSFHYNRDCFLDIGLVLSNNDFSSFSLFSANYDFLFNIGTSAPSSRRSLQTAADNPFSWFLGAGILPYETVGQGLTLKDFKQVGSHAFLSLRRFSSALSVWAQGYTYESDIYRLGLTWSLAPLVPELNILLFNQQGNSLIGFFDNDHYYYSLYALPAVSCSFRHFRFYAEYGFRNSKSKDLSFYYEPSPAQSHAFLAGVAWSDTLFGFAVSLNPEFRFYSAGFIPNTGVSQSFFGRLDDVYYSTNNWVDFFSSRERSLWYYASFCLQSPAFHGFSVFLSDEFLFFRSHQKIFFEDRLELDTATGSYRATPRAYAFNPSSNYYSFGINYSFLDHIDISLRLSNQLLNSDPVKAEAPYSQYLMRFFPCDHPFLDFRVNWHFRYEGRYHVPASR